MKVKHEKIRPLIEEIDANISGLLQAEEESAEQIEQVHSSFKSSASNLIHYRTLRTLDLSSLQKKLGNLGLSRVAHSESHIYASLDNGRHILKTLIGDPTKEHVSGPVSIKRAQKLLASHTKKLLGYRSKGRRVRVMVTLPIEAASNYQLVHDLLESGMNTARINCAHDDPEDWKKMIGHVAIARQKLKKKCRISMDLAGPKIRTGAIELGPEVRRFRPVRNEFGQVIEPARIHLVPLLSAEGAGNQLPVNLTWLTALKVNDEIALVDTRDKQRVLKVIEAGETETIATCLDTCYIKTGTLLIETVSNRQCLVKQLPATEQALLLKTGDTLRITKNKAAGRPALYNEQGAIIEDAFISCTSQEVFDCVKEGERILFDDGKIEGVIRKVEGDEISVEIVHTKANGASLKADKGINLPETNLNINGLTLKDKEDLKFVVRHADVINFSFVNSKEDVNELLTELHQLEVPNKLGIILKIETQKAYNNLTEIILEGMKNYPLGVMIARGDLAIECGWENMARVQEEILSLCNAAHVPVVWATQVLETLAKKGIPSRSEITDAASSLNAECVMLNKGPYIKQAVELLDIMLKNLNQYQVKNVKMLPKMEMASISNK